MKEFKTKHHLVKRKLTYFKEVPLYSLPSKFMGQTPSHFFGPHATL
jgi:hypothetical protein